MSWRGSLTIYSGFSKMRFFCLPLFVVLLALPGCPAGDPEPRPPMVGSATLVINNVAPSDSLLEEVIVEVRVRGPFDVGFSPNMLAPTETIERGEGLTVFLQTQGETGDWLVQITYRYTNDFWETRTATDEVKFLSVQEELIYTWNWPGRDGSKAAQYWVSDSEGEGDAR